MGSGKGETLGSEGQRNAFRELQGPPDFPSILIPTCTSTLPSALGLGLPIPSWLLPCCMAQRCSGSPAARGSLFCVAVCDLMVS